MKYIFILALLVAVVYAQATSTTKPVSLSAAPVVTPVVSPVVNGTGCKLTKFLFTNYTIKIILLKNKKKLFSAVPESKDNRNSETLGKAKNLPGLGNSGFRIGSEISLVFVALAVLTVKLF